MRDNQWKRASIVVPSNPRLVIATDSEGFFMAVYEKGEWSCAVTEEPFDSVITHWMEHPKLPEDDHEDSP